MMGFYPDCPGDPSYTLTIPVFDKVTIRLDPNLCGGNSEMTIIRNGEGQGLRSVRNASRTLKGFRISHKDLVKGAKLEFNCN